MSFSLLWAAIVGGAITAAGVRAYVMNRDRRIKRALHDVPATSIAAVADGKVVKIVGELVYTGKSIESPLSHRACAYYSIVVEQYISSGRSGYWKEIIREARSSAIFHSDADLERFVTEHGIAIEGMLFRKNIRASEGILEAGERVAVGGLARWMPDPDAAGGSYRETPKRLVLQASDAMPLFLSDDPAAL